MFGKIFIVLTILSSSIFVFSGCEQDEERMSTDRLSYPEEVKLKIKKNQLTSNDVMELFNREKNLENNKSGFKFDTGMKNIKHSKDFKVDINQLFFRLSAFTEFNPGMSSEKFSMPNENLQRINEVLEVTGAITEIKELDMLREKIIGKKLQSNQGEEYAKDFYLHRKKDFVLLNNKILDFRKKYLIEYDDLSKESMILNNVSDNYTAFLIGIEMKLFAEEHQFLSGNQEKGIKGMKKNEAKYLIEYSSNLINLSEKMGKEVSISE